VEASARRTTPEKEPGPDTGPPATGSATVPDGAAAARDAPAGKGTSTHRSLDQTGGPRRAIRRAWPDGAAIAGGLLLTLAFPPVGWWPLAPAAVALITVAIWRPGQGAPLRAGARLGFLAGAAFFFVLLYWLHVIGTDAWLILALVQALYFVPLGIGIAAVAHLRLAPLWAACLWIAEEAVRGRFPLGGFPWGRLAFSQSASPFTRYASLGGAPLLTFVVALAGGLIATAVTSRVTAPGPGRDRPRGAAPTRHWAVRAGAALGVVAVAAVGPAIPLPQPGGRTITAAVVQGNVPRLGLDFFGQRSAVLDDHVRAMHKLAALVEEGNLPQPDLVILPENSSDIDPYQDPAAYALINSAVRDVGVPTLVGVLKVSSDGKHAENRGIVWSPRTGAGAYYVKRHPIPFGEYVPLRSLLTKYIKQLQLIPYDQVAGRRVGVLRLGPVAIGDVICFEVAYDGIVRDAVTHGGRVIVVQTNNADYGRTDEPVQQLAISRLRAVEHARPVLIAATSGISAIITPDGQVLAQSRQFTQAILVRQIRTSSTVTLADRLGELPEWILTAAGSCAAALGILGLVTRDKTRRRQAA
jgi:apolipoprotein N-acyltransferase